MKNRLKCARERESGGDDFITSLNAHGVEGSVDGRGARIEQHGVRDAQALSPFSFKASRLDAIDPRQLAAV